MSLCTLCCKAVHSPRERPTAGPSVLYLNLLFSSRLQLTSFKTLCNIHRLIIRLLHHNTPLSGNIACCLI